MSPRRGRSAERAEAWGVQRGYSDHRGEWVEVPQATVDRVMEALGADSDAPPRPGAIVARIGEEPDLSEYGSLELEGGGAATLDRTLPADVPAGYHWLVHRDGSRSSLILSPGRCFLPVDLHVWGWAAQLYSVRSASSWGIGDLGDLGRLGRWSSGHGAEVMLINPLHAAMPTQPQQPSPYFPSSRCFRNPLYLRIEDVPGAAELEDIDELVAAGRALNDDRVIDRTRIYDLKLRALQEIWKRSRAPRGFDRYRTAHGDLLRDYTTFVALAEAFGSGPRGWHRDLAHPGAPAVARWRADNDDRVRFHGWVQWLIDDQLRTAARTTGIIHDLAIGVDPNGADAWVWQDVFASGATVGAPPDEFNTKGQGWGLPPFDPWKLRASGYEPFIQTIRACMRSGAGVRIDHVMGLFRLYWIPEGAGPADGAYVSYPHEDLLDIVALESHRAGAYVIGEDLGTVEPRVRDEMSARRMLSYRVMWFEDEPPASYPTLALAAATSHDLQTIAGMWTGTDLLMQQKLGLEPNVESNEAARLRVAGSLDLPENAPLPEVITEIHRLLGKAPSAVVVATLEDALAVEERPNVPGTLDERPNWSLALPATLEEIEPHPLVVAVAETLTSARASTTVSSGLGRADEGRKGVDALPRAEVTMENEKPGRPEDTEDGPREDVPAKHPTDDDPDEVGDERADAGVDETSKDSYPGSDAPAW
ncbi:MAG: 4-alpha-glucanotransferase [Actinomycetota bacterium]|nr:4-alpha-glucanotransferase [Actinomycetota bacterium]